MAQLKHTQEIERAVREMAPDARLSYRKGRKHRILHTELSDKNKNFAISSSPSQPDHAVRNTVREIAKFFGLEPPIKC